MLLLCRVVCCNDEIHQARAYVLHEEIERRRLTGDSPAILQALVAYQPRARCLFQPQLVNYEFLLESN